MFRGGRLRQQRNGVSIPIMLLGMQLFREGLEHIPPVTLVSILAQIAIYLQPHLSIIPSIQQACISVQNVWYFEDYKRLILAPFIHANDWHLYYNMMSFLVKGKSLERRFGSHYFLYLLLIFSLMSSAGTVWLALMLEKLTGNLGFLQQCAVGFSGVIFGLKVLTTHFQPSGTQYIMGFFPVPTRYAFWAELLFIQIIAPNSSFIGHLAGIIVGILYVKGPLKWIIDTPYHILMNSISGSAFSSGSRPNNSENDSYSYQTYTRDDYTSHENDTSQTPNSRMNNSPSEQYRYTGGLSEDQQLEEAIRLSRQEAHTRNPIPSAPPHNMNNTDFNSNTSNVYPNTSNIYPNISNTYPNTSNNYPNTSNIHPNTSNIYPDLSDNVSEQNRLNEEIRRRRLLKYQQ